MEYKLCDNPWNEEELKAIQEVINSDMYTMGNKVFEFEKEFAEKFGNGGGLSCCNG